MLVVVRCVCGLLVVVVTAARCCFRETPCFDVAPMEGPPLTLSMAMAVRPRACPGACVCLLYRPNAECFISDNGLVHVPAVVCARMNCGVSVNCGWGWCAHRHRCKTLIGSFENSVVVIMVSPSLGLGLIYAHT